LIELGGPPSEAWDLNDRGDVVGSATAADRTKHAMLWQAADGRGRADPIDLGIGVAHGINERGQIVGEFAGGSLRNPSALDRKIGSIVRVEARRRGSQAEQGAEVITINNRGQIIGSVRGMTTEVYPVRGFVWEGGKATDLGTLGAPHCHPRAVNDAGQVVGMSSYAAISRGIAPLYLVHAFLWERGKMRDLGALGAGRNSEALGLNEKGQVVGWSQTEGGEKHPAGGPRVAFLYSHGKMIDLNRLIPPDSGWTLREARAINDRGQIVGIGVRGGEARGFLLSPLASTKEGKIPRDFRIIAEYGPGGSVFGRDAASSWRETIDDDGRVTRAIDPATPAVDDAKEVASLSTAALNDLLDAVRGADYFTLGPRYQQSFHEGPALRLRVTASGKTHEVIAYASDFKRHNPEVKRFLRLWSEVIKKVPPPRPGEMQHRP
jgi:probable HAF family extracellular repeat protein